MKTRRIVALAAAALSILAVLAGCGHKPTGVAVPIELPENVTLRPAGILDISLPPSFDAQGFLDITARLQLYYTWLGDIRRDVQVLLDERQVVIELLAVYPPPRNYPCNDPPEHLYVLRDYVVRVSGLSQGVWSVSVNGVCKPTVARGAWTQGQSRIASISAASLPPATFHGLTSQLSVTLKHGSANRFYSYSTISLDGTNRRIRVNVYESTADSALPQQPWEETLELPIVFPSSGWWELAVGNEVVLKRRVLEYRGMIPEDNLVLASYVYQLSPRTWLDVPREVSFEEPVIAGRPTIMSLSPELCPFHWDFLLEVSCILDPCKRELTGALLASNIVRDNHSAEDETITVTFPLAGEWTIRFEGEEGQAPFTTTVTVLP